MPGVGEGVRSSRTSNVSQVETGRLESSAQAEQTTQFEHTLGKAELMYMRRPSIELDAFAPLRDALEQWDEIFYNEPEEATQATAEPHSKRARVNTVGDSHVGTTGSAPSVISHGTAEPHSKRARANTVGDSHVDTTGSAPSASPQVSAEEVSRLVVQLHEHQLVQIVNKAAQIHPDILDMIKDTISAMRAKERSRPINFDGYSKSVWRLINITHSSKSGSRQYDAAFDVVEEVNETIETIANLCGPFASPGTRFNGLSVLRKIGKTIALSSNNTVGHEVQKNFQFGYDNFEKSMLKIIGFMEPEEVRAIQEDVSNPEALLPKLRELEKLAEDYCIFERLSEVLEALGDYYEEGEEDREGEEDEES
jgi:hypothetical protein